MPPPIVDYKKFYRYYGGGPQVYYTQHPTDDSRKVKHTYPGVLRNPMGKFAEKLFTKEGKEVLAAIRLFAGGVEQFRGARNGGMYFKWVAPHNTSDRFMVMMDWLRDRGYECTIKMSKGNFSRKRTVAEAKEDGTYRVYNRMTYKRDARGNIVPDKVRRETYTGSRNMEVEYIKVDITYDKVEMPKPKRKR